MAVPGPPGATDVLIVSVGATTGWRAAARELGAAFQAAGARTVTVDTGPVAEVRTFMLTDLVQALAARRAAARGIAEHGPRIVVYCSITAALLWPAPGVIWLDAIAAENRPGRHGVWQRAVERRRLARAPLVLTMAPDSLAPLRAGGRRSAPAVAPEQVVVPVAVQSSGAPAAARDVDVVAYAADPVKRRLDFVLDTWRRTRRGEETLVVTGIDRVPDVPGVRFTGRLPPDEFRALLRRARVFVAASRREDFGIAQLEALADGAMLVATPAPGPYPALGLARALDPRLVAEDLAPALRAALDDPAPGYSARAAELIAPFSREAVATTLTQHVLPRLMPGWGA
jgi:glycosyltransferase involved in cell wall biosynthesis